MEPSSIPASMVSRRSSVFMVPRREVSKRVVSTSQSQELTLYVLDVLWVPGVLPDPPEFVRGTAASLQTWP